MKKVFKRLLLLTISCTLFAISSTAMAASPCPNEGEFYFASEGTGTCRALTPDEIWTELMTGNGQYVSGTLTQLDDNSQPVARQRLGTKGQKPEAIILTCSDSRLPPEILFNAGLGRLFVVRVAGNIVNPHELGSIEYAVEHLGARLIVVLGHEKCGAVKATHEAYPAAGDPLDGIGSLVASIRPAVHAVITRDGSKLDGDATQINACVQENIDLVAGYLKSQSTIISEYVDGRAEDLLADPPVEAIAAGTVKIYRAYYKLDTGVVTGSAVP